MSKNVRNNSLQLKQRTNPADPRRHSYGTTVFNQERHSESLVLGLGFRRDSPFDPDYEDVETEQLAPHCEKENTSLSARIVIIQKYTTPPGPLKTSHSCIARIGAAEWSRAA